MPGIDGSLLVTAEDFGFRLGGLAAAIWVSEQTNLTRLFVNSRDSMLIRSAKTSVFLAVAEIVSDQVLQRLIGKSPPSLFSDVKIITSSILSNMIVFFALDQFGLDDMITGGPSASPEMRAVRLAILFIIANEISTRILSRVLNVF